jgi:hypothetical protein
MNRDSERMNAQEAEARYGSLKSRFDAGQIPLDEFNRRVSELRYLDNTGTWWTISPIDGRWLRWNGTVWEPASGSKTPSPTARQQGTPMASVPPVHSGASEERSARLPAAGVRSPATGPAWPAGKKYAAGSIACGVIAFFLYPYILGCAGILLGIIAVKEKYMAGAAGILLSAAVIPVAFLTSGHFGLPV